MPPRWPDVEVRLVGENGNAFHIVGRVSQALKRAGASKAEIERYQQEATSGDYNHLLTITLEWVEVK